MKQRLIMLLFLVCIVPYPLSAGECEEDVSSLGAKLYNIDSASIKIHTLKCYETFESSEVLARSDGATGETFSSYHAGNYRVTITREKKNWYKISGQNIYIFAQKCLINVIEQEALLSLRNDYRDGNGSLHFEREGCKVIGLYKSMSL